MCAILQQALQQATGEAKRRAGNPYMAESRIPVEVSYILYLPYPRNNTYRTVVVP